MKRPRSRRRPPPSPMPALFVVSLLVLVGDPRRADAFSGPPLLPATLQIRPSAVGVNAPMSARSVDRPATGLFSASESDGDDSGSGDDREGEATPAEVVADSLTASQIESLKSESKSLLSNLKDFLTNKSKFNRESLGKLGMSALLAYGFVSNVSGVLAVSSAWFIFSKKVRPRSAWRLVPLFVVISRTDSQRYTCNNNPNKQKIRRERRPWHPGSGRRSWPRTRVSR